MEVKNIDEFASFMFEELSSMHSVEDVKKRLLAWNDDDQKKNACVAGVAATTATAATAAVNAKTRVKTESELRTLKIKQLKEICVAHSLPTSGLKGNLIDRILTFDGCILRDVNPGEPRPLSIRDKKCVTMGVTSSKKRKLTADGKCIPPAPPVQVLVQNRNYVTLSSDGVDLSTNFKFNDANVVCGKVSTDGDIVALSSADIELCKERNLKYEVPDDIDL